MRRPIYNPHLLVPNLDVAVNIPSIKMVLSDKEYQLISSMAGDNFAEPLKVPQAAQWLQQYYTTAPDAIAPPGSGGFCCWTLHNLIGDEAAMLLMLSTNSEAN